MEKRGFTLVEMLGVMTLLVVIFALIFPNVMNMMEKGKQNEYDEYLSNVYLATEAYVNSNIEVSSSLNVVGSTVTVTFSDLLTSGYLNSKLVNPKTNKKTSSTPELEIVVTVANDKTFAYSIKES